MSANTCMVTQRRNKSVFVCACLCLCARLRAMILDEFNVDERVHSLQHVYRNLSEKLGIGMDMHL